MTTTDVIPQFYFYCQILYDDDFFFFPNQQILNIFKKTIQLPANSSAIWFCKSLPLVAIHYLSICVDWLVKCCSRFSVALCPLFFYCIFPLDSRIHSTILLTNLFYFVHLTAAMHINDLEFYEEMQFDCDRLKITYDNIDSVAHILHICAPSRFVQIASNHSFSIYSNSIVCLHMIIF